MRQVKPLRVFVVRQGSFATANLMWCAALPQLRVPDELDDKTASQFYVSASPRTRWEKKPQKKKSTALPDVYTPC